MANFFDQFDAPAASVQPRPAAPASNFFDQFDAPAPVRLDEPSLAGVPMQEQAPLGSYKGQLLPFSRDASGNLGFDSDAGILGMVKSAGKALYSGATLPSDVYAGRVDPRSDEAIGRAFELATAASPVNAAVRSGDRAIPGVARAMQPGQVAAPTREALEAATDAGYDAVRNSGVVYHGDAVGEMARAARAGLEKDGVLAELAPKSFAILEKLSNPPAGSTAPIQNLDAARRAFGHARKDFTNPTEQMAAGRIVDALDGFVTKADPKSVMAGDAAGVAKTLTDARGNAAAGFRSDRLRGVEERADLKAAAANSGANGDNAIRTRVADVILNPKQAQGFNEAELAAMRETAEGTRGRNVLRTFGNLAGGGGGLGAAVTGGMAGYAGGAFGPLVGAAIGGGVPAAGYGAKTLATALTRRSLQGVDEMTRMRSPLAEQLLAGAPQTAIDPAKKAALLRGLMLSQQ